MGEWRVRVRWGAPPYHPGTHDENDCCEDSPVCLWVVEQHQYQGPDVPEFTISVKWQDGDLHEYLGGKNSRAHGWRYVMRWREGDDTRVVSGFGFGTEGMARQAAEEKATKIVKAQQPEKVYKFRPEV